MVPEAVVEAVGHGLHRVLADVVDELLAPGEDRRPLGGFLGVGGGLLGGEGGLGLREQAAGLVGGALAAASGRGRETRARSAGSAGWGGGRGVGRVGFHGDQVGGGRAGARGRSENRGPRRRGPGGGHGPRGGRVGHPPADTTGGSCGGHRRAQPAAAAAGRGHRRRRRERRARPSTPPRRPARPATGRRAGSQPATSRADAPAATCPRPSAPARRSTASDTAIDHHVRTRSTRPPTRSATRPSASARPATFTAKALSRRKSLFISGARGSGAEGRRPERSPRLTPPRQEISPWTGVVVLPEDLPLDLLPPREQGLGGHARDDRDAQCGERGVPHEVLLEVVQHRLDRVDHLVLRVGRRAVDLLVSPMSFGGPLLAAGLAELAEFRLHRLQLGGEVFASGGGGGSGRLLVVGHLGHGGFRVGTGHAPGEREGAGPGDPSVAMHRSARRSESDGSPILSRSESDGPPILSRSKSGGPPTLSRSKSDGPRPRSVDGRRPADARPPHLPQCRAGSPDPPRTPPCPTTRPRSPRRHARRSRGCRPRGKPPPSNEARWGRSARAG